jgi:hypothetical protein
MQPMCPQTKETKPHLIKQELVFNNDQSLLILVQRKKQRNKHQNRGYLKRRKDNPSYKSQSHNSKIIKKTRDKER